MMKLLTVLCTALLCTSLSQAYRDGARENSCYDHSIIHDGATIVPCVESSNSPCPYSVLIREVMNEATLELGGQVTRYECGRIYGMEVRTTLNAAEGFLVQARNGTNDSSEIIGTFLSRSTVMERDSSVPLNFKILECNRSISDSDNETLPNSATHPNTVNMAGTLQLFWQAPDCSTCGLRDVTIWFTVVQQLQIVYSTSKSTELELVDYIEPMECSPSSSILSPSITMTPTLTTPPSTSILTLTRTPIPTRAPPPPNPPAGDGDGSGLSMTAVIGLAAGVSVGGLVLIALVVVFIVVVCMCVAKSEGEKKPSRESVLWAVDPPEKDGSVVAYKPKSDEVEINSPTSDTKPLQ